MTLQIDADVFTEIGNSRNMCIKLELRNRAMFLMPIFLLVANQAGFVCVAVPMLHCVTRLDRDTFALIKDATPWT